MGPVALAWTAVALAGVGAGVSALGSMNQANSNSFQKWKAARW